MSRTRWIAVAVALLSLVASGYYLHARLREPEPIRIGILHSIEVGTMAKSERPIVDAYRLAIDDINAAGGVNGHPIVADTRDGKSDLDTFRREAESLVRDGQVCTIFGCWTSACHRTVKAVVESDQYRNLLFYPVEYEGLVDPGRVVYTGAVPNQQIIPAVTWLYNQGKRRFFLIGSDYVFPRCANEIAIKHIEALGAKWVANEFVLLGPNQDQRIREIVGQIKAKLDKGEVDVILNTINGDKNIALFQELRRQGVTPDQLPTMSSSMGEPELRSMAEDGLDLRKMQGDFATWNYFQSITDPANESFVEQFRRKYGPDRVTSDPIEAGYFGIYLWKQAVEDAIQTKGWPVTSDDILAAIRRQSFHAPEGVVYIDPENLHTWKVVRVGRILADGQFLIEWESGRPIRPVPYPIHKSTEWWKGFLDDLYRRWGGKWANEAKG